MRWKFPKATFLIMLFSIVVCLWGNEADWAIYERSRSEELWRFLLASFAHYDTQHLALNLLAFSVLGGVIEQQLSGKYLCAITVCTALAATFFLHFFLSKYSSYAGISTVNYALLGYLVISRLKGRVVELLLFLTLCFCYQLYAVLEVGSSSMLQVKPVWQLHILALLAGVLWALGTRKRITNKKRDISFIPEPCESSSSSGIE